MKKLSVFFFLLVLSASGAFAQDMVVKLDSSIVDGKVVEYNKSRIRVVKALPPNDTISLQPSEVHFIRYGSGVEQIVTLPPDQTDPVSNRNGNSAGIGVKLNKKDLYFDGLMDGKAFNKKYAVYEMCGSCCATSALGVLGTGGAIAYALNPVNPWNLKQRPDEELLQNDSYVRGFQDGVKKARLKNIVIGSAVPIVIGTGLLIAVFVLQ